MPYTITWEGRSAMNIAYSGQTSDQEVLEVVMIQSGDERFDNLRSVLHDFTGIEACSYSSETLTEIGIYTLGAGCTNPRFKIAIVTDRQDVSDMVKEFLEMGCCIYPLQVFPTVAAAKAWLGANKLMLSVQGRDRL